MRTLDWIREVIADVGEHDPIPIHLERTREGSGYALRLGVRAGFGGQETARIPVFKRMNPAPHPLLKEIHYCEVGGQTLEAANVYALRDKVGRVLEQDAPGRALPLCYFRVPAMDYELPAYEHGGNIVCPVLGGPRLRAQDLAGIRARVCRYLVSAGYVSDADEVEVGVLRPSDLRRVPPATVFRSLTEPEVWIPSVEGHSAEGEVVGVLGHPTRLRRGRGRRRAGPAVKEAAPSAPDVIALLRFVRVELARGGDIDPMSIYASEVRREIWAAAEARTEDTGSTLVAYLTDDDATTLELSIRATGAGELAVALDDRCINAFLAPDEDALATQVGSYLRSSGFLRFSEEIEVHRPRPPRPERLEADSIWTFGRDDEVIAATADGGADNVAEKEVEEAWSSP